MTGAEFKQIRKRLGLSQVDMASALGYLPNRIVVWRWEKGERPIREPIARLARLMVMQYEQTRGVSP